MPSNIDLSIIIPARNEATNLSLLLPEVHQVLNNQAITYEILVCDEIADEETISVVKENLAILHKPELHGYGSALQSGFRRAQGQYIITMDADLSHPAEFLTSLWNARQTADVIIASRYVKGGLAIMPLDRLILSRILNNFFSWGLALHVRDMSSGYRMYRREFIKGRTCEGRNFNILQELLVYAIVDGYSIREIPFTYQPRQHGSSHARVFRFGLNYLQTFYHLRRIRRAARKEPRPN
jgi:dolichol-phosphate mannosyltransferase